MGSQVSHRQKKDLAKYYTSLLGAKENQGSVQAYMSVAEPASAHQNQTKKKKKIKKK